MAYCRELMRLPAPDCQGLSGVKRSWVSLRFVDMTPKAPALEDFAAVAEASGGPIESVGCSRRIWLQTGYASLGRAPRRPDSVNVTG